MEILKDYTYIYEGIYYTFYNYIYIVKISDNLYCVSHVCKIQSKYTDEISEKVFSEVFINYLDAYNYMINRIREHY